MKVSTPTAVALVGMVPLLVSACLEPTEQPETATPECAAGLRMFVPARAERDAQQALRRGTREILGVYGFVDDYPGVSDTRPKIEGYSVRMIEDTSDCIESKECERFNNAAVQYAETYNRVMLADIAVQTPQ